MKLSDREIMLTKESSYSFHRFILQTHPTGVRARLDNGQPWPSFKKWTQNWKL